MRFGYTCSVMRAESVADSQSHNLVQEGSIPSPATKPLVDIRLYGPSGEQSRSQNTLPAKDLRRPVFMRKLKEAE